jgi:hypothetical protein
MRSSLLTLLLAVTMSSSLAAPAPQPADLFDFWLGDWQVTWKNADGTIGHAHNHVSRILDGQVIEERFEADAGGTPPLLKGRSLSVRDAQGQWHQAWADNQGGFFALAGSADGDKRLFSTALVAAGGQVKGQRMVFHHIAGDAFTWDWEGTADGGRTWTPLWQLDYRRAPRAAGD